jgi:hypothetical protein
MKTRSGVKAVGRSIRGLFIPNKPNVTHINHKDQYFNAYYLPKNLCEGIELVAALEHITKKLAAEMLMTRGFSSYMGEKLKEQIENDNQARGKNQKMPIARFVRVMRRYAREHGMDISKII